MTVAHATVCSIVFCVDGEKRVLMYAYVYDTATDRQKLKQQQR